MAKIIQSFKNICFEAIQNGSKSNRGFEESSVVKFLVTEKCKLCGYGEACFNQKILYIWVKHGFSITILNQKVYRVKTH